MNNILIGKDSWLSVYRNSKDRRSDSPWLVCRLTNNLDIYLSTNNKINEVFEYCKKNNLNVESVWLQFRSNKVKIDISDSEGVYITKSARGKFGGNTLYCITIGRVVNGVVYKKSYCLPELLKIHEYEDKVENCFEELILYKDEQKRKTKAIQ